jgi:hypothetical protein
MRNKMECEHKNIYPNYYRGYSCGTPYCGVTEFHCKDCGRFVTRCGCGSWNGESGWSWYRTLKHWRKKDKNKIG